MGNCTCPTLHSPPITPSPSIHPLTPTQYPTNTTQINQDGAGPFTADIDPTSGGTLESAMQPATIIQDVPGLGFGGLSLATNTEFEMLVQMPAGMVCEGMVAGTPNVCVMRVRNGAAAGPFGGSVAFTQSGAARKRALGGV